MAKRKKGMKKMGKSEESGEEQAGEQTALKNEAADARGDSETDVLLQQTREQLLRALADMENLRKRGKKELQEARQYAVENFARDLLSVPDNLSRALDVLSLEDRCGLSESGAKLLDGIEMTRKDLYSVLERHGVTIIEAEAGSVFNPERHQAVSKLVSPFPQGTIAQTLQIGWSLQGRILRAAMVAVSSGSAEDSTPSNGIGAAAVSADSSASGSSVDIKV